MYGYVTPVKSQISTADFVLYRAFYCGICMATGKSYGQLPRFTTNYDIVFLSVLLHDYTKQDVEFETGTCVLNPFKKKATVCQNLLFDKIVATNIVLSYYKTCDDVLDSNKKLSVKKRMAKNAMKKPYNKAKLIVPEVDEIVNKRYTQLYKLEKENCAQIDRVADCFALLLMEVAEYLLKQHEIEPCENILKLCYNVGKFVYLADALDDIDEDFKKKNYNPFLAKYDDFKSRQEFFIQHKEELEFLLACTTNRAIECFNQLIFTQSYDLLKNIVHVGLRDKTKEIFDSAKKLPKPRI